MSTSCRSCGAAIEFVVTASGKQMPIDMAPTPCARCNGDGYRMATGGDSPHTFAEPCAPCDGLGVVRLSHFATCPHAAAHRKRSG